ncbi:AHH domain-containing protein [Agarilytica rhodophyticola]|uniref:AHH domain-containing protein n=1 Tax=Agarilytica rhodophyticola TaxID=1737490 RepID=UPI000B34525B|nr:AHH domain-containing protein [Agarilytica rhodophyticola]
MDSDALLNERHYSSRMALQLKRAGFPRPSSHCDAHAIISGSHKLAAQMRAILAWLKMRIDDHHNGCWLPRNITDRVHMPAFLRDAVPHQNVHTKAYYQWLEHHINPIKITSLDALVKAFRKIRFSLQSGIVPKNIWS